MLPSNCYNKSLAEEGVISAWYNCTYTICRYIHHGRMEKGRNHLFGNHFLVEFLFNRYEFMF